ncbi:hypothetical protein QBC46DRAFT_273862, partial [Diplogelasinospora grovesii]
KHFDTIKIIIFISFSLIEIESRYSILKKEILIVVRALIEMEWIIMVLLYLIYIYTDHLSIV